MALEIWQRLRPREVCPPCDVLPRLTIVVGAVVDPVRVRACQVRIPPWPLGHGVRPREAVADEALHRRGRVRGSFRPVFAGGEMLRLLRGEPHSSGSCSRWLEPLLPTEVGLTVPRPPPRGRRRLRPGGLETAGRLGEHRLGRRGRETTRTLREHVLAFSSLCGVGNGVLVEDRVWRRPQPLDVVLQRDEASGRVVQPVPLLLELRLRGYAAEVEPVDLPEFVLVDPLIAVQVEEREDQVRREPRQVGLPQDDHERLELIK
mmetsp:Transcript_69330/g.206458  ORF Transcript_69330/g.206458 Transcript_69330/m.206458 type:complete len:261 (-) Transcript_69330:387-1169(-)